MPKNPLHGWTYKKGGLQMHPGQLPEGSSQDFYFPEDHSAQLLKIENKEDDRMNPTLDGKVVKIPPKVPFSVEKLHLSILRLIAACDLVCYLFLL